MAMDTGACFPMALVAVAPRRAAYGVEAPGTRKKIRGSLDTWTFDWREPPGSEENTARIRAPYVPTHLEDALARTYPTDAHLVSYVVQGPDGHPLERQPRVNKSSLDWFDAQGYTLRVDVLIADVDNPDHVNWTPKLRENFDQLWSDSPPVLETTGVYLTRGGYRLIQPLDEPLSVAEVEGYLLSWLGELQAAGIPADDRCKDWTRLMRLPNVRRDRQPYVSPFVDLSRLAPRLIKPITRSVPTSKKKTKPTPAPPKRFAREVPPEMRGTADILAAPMRGAYHGERHAVSLHLAAVLLEQGVPPGDVPSVVEAAATLAGWNDPSHHRVNAEDTVSKAAAGHTVRTDIPPGLRRAVERVFNVETPDAPRPIDEVSEALYQAILNAPEGPSAIVAGCGVGKSHQARRVALTRSKAPKKLDRKTVISAPTNELAVQYADRLREKGAKVLRVFGPQSVRGDHDGWECRYRAAAVALAAGGQSARWELCEGRGKIPCPYQDDCKAYGGQDGPTDASIVVGNHGLVSELDSRAGKMGLLILDEPPAIMADEVISEPDLENARLYLDKFVSKVAYAMRPLLERLSDGMGELPLREAKRIEDLTGIELDADDILTDDDGRRRSAPQLMAESVRGLRHSTALAKLVGDASRVLKALCWAYSQPDVRCAVYQSKTANRYLAITGLDERLTKALRRDYRVVVMAADTDLHVEAIERATCVGVPVQTFRARDGCRVRRVHMYTRGATRKRWLVMKHSPKAALEQALAIARKRDPIAKDAERVNSDKAPPKVLVVTFKDLAPAVRKLVPDGVEVHHYRALRGLDGWKDFDAVVTLGDDISNLDHVSRTGLSDELDHRAAELCAAELEQAHGRLRTIHRDRPAVMVHVGRVRPRGWPPDEVEEIGLSSGWGQGQAVDLEQLKRGVEEAGGVSAAARLLGVSRKSLQRWLLGGRVRDPKVLAPLVRTCAQVS